MHKTEKKHWRNGYDKRGSFRCFAFSAGNFGVLLTNSRMAGVITVYRLV